MFTVENGLRPAPTHKVIDRSVSRYCDPGNGKETFTVSWRLLPGLEQNALPAQGDPVRHAIPARRALPEPALGPVLKSRAALTDEYRFHVRLNQNARERAPAANFGSRAGSPEPPDRNELRVCWNHADAVKASAESTAI